MAGKLHQVLAVVASKKKRASEVITQAYHLFQKPALFAGISKTYRPKDEEGDQLPPEYNAVQTKVTELIKAVTDAAIETYDVVATQDWANCSAKADVSINGRVLLKQVPVTHLLFLEKQLADVATFIGKLPTLDPSEIWSHNSDTDQYATPPSETVRTKKVPKAFVKAPATEQHPAQVEVFHEDIVAGYWKTVKFSGAIPAKAKNEILERVRMLQEAVVKAREEANSTEAPPVSVGKEVFGFIFE